MKKMKIIGLLIFSVCLSWCTSGAMAQSGIIKGTIKSETGSAIPNASVQLKGAASGVVTNDAGEFELYGKKGDLLVITAIGNEHQEVA